MQFLLPFLFLFLFSEVNAQLKTNIYWTQQTSYLETEVIYYGQHRHLLWKDFLGKPPAESPAAAITASGFGYKADIKRVENEGQLNVAVYCFFNKLKSWVKTDKNTTYILNHEQHHFDISFIAANIFMNKLKTASFTFDNYNTTLSTLYTESMHYMNKLQKDYDGQTKNGQLREEQTKWDTNLTERLQEFIK
ncbi:MAG: hypothetical protein WEA59_09840 [Ferruginibacter sp.]